MGNFDDTKSSLMTTISASAPTSPSGVDEDSRSLEYSTRDWIDARDLDSGLIHAPAQTYYKAENHQPRMRDKVYVSTLFTFFNAIIDFGTFSILNPTS